MGAMRKPLYILLCLSVLAGCAGSTVFQPWPDRASSWRHGLAEQPPAVVREQLDRGLQGNNRLLYLQERGRLAELAGDFQASRQDYTDAIRLYREEDEQALIRLSGVGATGSALLTNDNALPYRGEDYERILLHGFQAMNYWATGDLEGAAVEFRRVTEAQRNAESRREREIQRAEEEARDKDIDIHSFPEELGGLNAAAADVRSSVENAWLYYLAGLFREGTGDYNNAAVDYRRALQIRPEMELIEEDLRRVQARQDRRYRDDRGLVVISHEQGLVPPRREISLPIPTRHGYVAVAFPTYDPADFGGGRPLRIETPDGQTLQTREIARIDAMAARALRERVPGMLLRQTLRARTKYEAQKQAEEFGILGMFFVQIYNLVSEQADLRSWLTLPAGTRVARTEMEPGEHRLKLSGPGGGASVDVPVTSGGITVIRVFEAGGRMHTRVMPVLEERR